LSRRPFRKPLRLLVPTVLAGAVVLVPGVAFASNDDPTAPVANQVRGALDQVAGGGTNTASGSDPVTIPASPIDPAQGGTDGGPDGGTPSLPSPPDDSALRDAFIKALAPLGISADCVNGVFDGFQNVLDALQNSDPQQLPDLLNQLVGALQNGGQGFDPSSLSDNDVATALQGLATTLQEKCMPAPPTAGGSHNPPPPAASQPVVPAAHPAPAAAAPAAQPVSYPGYAPTGGTPEQSSSPVPLAVLGGVVLLSGVGAAGYRMSTRAARSRG
jgi:hypothetical protein